MRPEKRTEFLNFLEQEFDTFRQIVQHRADETDLDAPVAIGLIWLFLFQQCLQLGSVMTEREYVSAEVLFASMQKQIRDQLQ